MRVVSALEVRARFGQIVDEAAAGERVVIERAGTPVAAIVPLADLEAIDPDRVVDRQLEAVRRIARRARQIRSQGEPAFDAAAWIRHDRDTRDTRDTR